MDRRRLQQIFIIALTYLILTAADDVDDFDEATVEVVEEPSVDIPYTSPTPIDPAKVYLAEHFDDSQKFEKNWIKSAAKKEGISEDIAKYDGEWRIESPQKDGLIGDLGLVLKSKAKHSAISSRLSRPFVFNTKPLIVQYEVFLQDGQECGGAYLKLLTDGSDTKNLGLFHDKTPYTIMFGPDKCGHDHKLHFIFRHVNPRNGSIEEKHCKKPKDRLDDYFADKLPHLYTLQLKPDNTFEILVDKKLINSGSLLEDFTPPVNPPSEIDDPNDKKPADWDEREKIPDPEAVKPDDWDEDAPAQIIDENAVIPDGWLEEELRHIPDPDAVRPDDWDSEMDGEWEPPLIDNPACTNAVGCGKWEPPLINNPKYKGKWVAPFIDNPNYKGKWRPRRIPNPDFFEDTNPFRMQTISAVGFELWTMSSDIYFDNLIVTDDMVVAEHWAAETFDIKRQKIAKDSATLWGRMLRSMNYRPKSWALFGLYCAIPICFYIRYIWFCVKEASVVERLAKLTNDYPALWLLYIVILGIPVTVILYLCCKPSSSASQQEREEQRQAADKKKTDEVTEDDPQVKNEEAQEEVKEQAPVEEDEDKEKYSDQDDNEEDVIENEGEKEKEKENEENIEEPSKTGEGDVPRKRKPRKE